MDNNQIVAALFDAVQNNNLDIAGADKKFYTKLVLHAAEIRDLYTQLYNDQPESSANFTKLIEVLISSHLNRSQDLKDLDNKKPENWYLSNELAGMSLYLDRFSANLADLPDRFPYLQDLGINVLHLMSADNDLEKISALMHEQGMFLMLDLLQNDAVADYSNSKTLVNLLTEVFANANLGVDILRIDAAALQGHENQSNAQVHTMLQLIRQCVQVTAPGMTLLCAANVSSSEMIKYFGEGRYMSKGCHFAYNVTQMALQWDALASGQVSIMLAAQPVLTEKPFGTTWITYTRSHNDIKLSHEDSAITDAGYTPLAHRKYLNDYFTGEFPGSESSGALFSVHAETQNATISGTLASLCGLEKAINEKSEIQISTAIQKILLMQANSCFLGGLPMLFYGDETGYLNDYSYLDTPEKSIDNRWMHRPMMDWNKNELAFKEGTIENRIFSGTRKLLTIRKSLNVVADSKNIRWLPRHNIHVAGFVRNGREKPLYCLFNYSNERAYLTWHSFRYNGTAPEKLYDHWNENYFEPGGDAEFLMLEPYEFYLLEVVS